MIGRRTYSFYLWAFLALIGITGGLDAGLGALDAFRVHLSTAPALQGSLLILAAAAPALCFASVLVSAVYRSVLEPEGARFAYLRLGWTEARMLAFTLVAGLFWMGSGLVAMSSGRWALPVNLIAVALASPLAFIGPAVFRSGRSGLRDGWRLGSTRWRELLVMNLVTWAICAIGLIASLAAWRLYAHAVLVSASQDFLPDSGSYPLRLAPGLLPAAMAYTAIFVIAVAPAAAAYRKLAEPEAVTKAKAFA